MNEGDAWLGRVARVIAIAFATGDQDPPAMAARARVAIGDERDDWLEPLAAEMAELLGPLGEAPGEEPGDGDNGDGEDAETRANALRSLILHSDTFTYVARSQQGDERVHDENVEVAGLIADTDPDLARTLRSDDGSWARPWPDEAVRAAPTELPTTPWTRRGSVHPPVGPTSNEADNADTGGGRRARGVISWPVPTLDRPVDLAEWFGLHPLHLAWYCDVRSMERDARSEPLRHYSYRWIPKRSGGTRLLEAPKPVLRFFQRRVLHEILDAIPTHPAAHGFVPGRSVHSFATPHEGHDVVIRLDLESFFASVHANRVFGTFRTAGYPEPVAHLLTGLVTNRPPHAVLRVAPRPPAHATNGHHRSMAHLGRPHLPQGAPTSPALANLVAFGLDCRLAGLARSFDATYTRSADDLAFAGGYRLGRHASAFVHRVRAIVAAEGFAVNPAKTRVMRSGECQSVAGMVVNGHAQVSRRDYDRLRAVLHDAATNGPDAANRDAHPAFASHLLGRIGWVATGNDRRARKLRYLYDAISW